MKNDFTGDTGTLFKNPLVTRDNYHTPAPDGWFETRRLDSTKAANVAIIANVMAVVKSGDMIAKAKAEYDAKQKAERDEQEAFANRREQANRLFRTMRDLTNSSNNVRFELDSNMMQALLSYAPDDNE